MKKCVVLVLILFTAFVNAETGYLKGKIEYVRIHDKSIHTSVWMPPVFWFTLEGVNKAGTCPIWGENVLFVMDTEQAYSMVIAAYMAEKEVSIRFDDSLLNPSKFCKATYMTLGSPPPLK
ncbi:hypothetical protein AB6E04_00885 [Vibrio amylolyticus]|uniref:hypothetical protein n=1 Tax=Vibrio amylolyticus TaxID=2847292 RepID=UPI00354ADD62